MTGCTPRWASPRRRSSCSAATCTSRSTPTSSPAVASWRHEWTTSSITSQNLADKKGWAKNVESRPIVDHLVETFPDLHWADTDSHGFLVVTVDGDAASCEWWSLDTVAEPSDGAEVGHRTTLTASGG